MANYNNIFPKKSWQFIHKKMNMWRHMITYILKECVASVMIIDTDNRIRKQSPNFQPNLLH